MIVVTRHAALVDFLRQEGLVPDGVKVVTHATAEDVRGEDVIGVLPLHLAAEASTVTTVDLDIPPEMRGKELSVADIRRFCREIATYRVERVR